LKPVGKKPLPHAPGFVLKIQQPSPKIEKRIWQTLQATGFFDQGYSIMAEAGKVQGDKLIDLFNDLIVKKSDHLHECGRGRFRPAHLYHRHDDGCGRQPPAG
jgi:hypothetical protein